MRTTPAAALAVALFLGGAATEAWAQAADPDDLRLLETDGPDELRAPPGAEPAEGPRDLRRVLDVVECRSGAWLCLLRGALRKDGLGLSGVHLGRAELGMPRANTVSMLELTTRLPLGGQLVGEALDFTLRGTTVPGQPISFGGTPLAMGQPLRTGLRLTSGTAVARYPLIAGADHRLDCDAGLQLVRVHLRLTQPDLRLGATAISPFVLFGLHSRHRVLERAPGPWWLELDLGAGHWPPLGVGSHQRNWSFRIRVALSVPLVRLSAEPGAPATAAVVVAYDYRYLDQERFRHVDKRDIDLELHGPQLAVRVVF